MCILYLIKIILNYIKTHYDFLIASKYIGRYLSNTNYFYTKVLNIYNFNY